MTENTEPVTANVNPQVHPKFLELLESGDYAQTTKRLAVVDTRAKDGRRYCAMGLACEAYRQDTGKGEWLTSDQLRERNIEHIRPERFDNATVLYFVTEVESRDTLNGKTHHTNVTAPPFNVLDWVGLAAKSDFRASLDQPNKGISRVVKAAIKKAQGQQYYHYNYRYLSFITLNDSLKLKFSTIAKFIREVRLTY